MDKKKLSSLYKKEPGVLVTYLDFLNESPNHRRSTAYNYYMTLRSLAKYLKHYRNKMDCEPDEVIMSGVSAEEMLSISRKEWGSYLDYCEPREAPSSFAVRISIIRGFYDWLCTEHGTPAIEFIVSEARPVIDFDKCTFIEVTDKMEFLLCRGFDGVNEVRNICITKLALHCGLGLQEICDLNLEDIELRTIQVANPSGHKRPVPLDDEAIAIINIYISERIPPTDGSNAFFVSANKARLRRGAVQKMLRRTTRRVGGDLIGVTYQDLQMTGKIRLAKRIGDESLQEILNISSPYYFRNTFSVHDTNH